MSRSAPMAARLLLAAAALASRPANAQEENAAVQESDVPPSDLATSTPNTPSAPLWTVSASAGVSTRDDGPDGSWEALALSRQIGRGYVRGALMRYHGTLQQADTALPSDYLIGTLSAGGNFAGWVADGWVSYGWQDYGRISTSAGSRPSNGATGSPYLAIGGDFGKVLPLGKNWYLTPTVTASYAHGRLLRPAPTGTAYTDLETEEPAWSASGALRLDHAFGREDNHYVGLSISRNWTSNAVSTAKPRELGNTNGSTDALALDSVHYADGWFEVGATANMELTKSLHLDLFASRGFGMLAGDTTSVGASLRISF